jgi:hypothetical protein
MIDKIEIKTIEKRWWCSIDIKTGDYIDEPFEVTNDQKILTNVSDINGNIIKRVIEADTYDDLMIIKDNLNTVSRISVQISNHPYDNLIKRQAIIVDFTNFNLIDGEECISLRVLIAHFKDVNAIKELDGYIVINATNKEFVPNTNIGVFDYLYDLINQGAKFDDVCKIGVLLADSDGSINSKLYK